MNRATPKNSILVCALMGVMVASQAMATNNLRYQASGSWTDTLAGTGSYGWQAGGGGLNGVPGVGDQGVINWAGNTVTLTTTESIGELRVGQDEVGNLVVTSTGNLTTDSSLGQNANLTLGQGNNSAGTGYLDLQAGGVVNVGGIMYNGLLANGTADIYGTLSVTSHLWTGWNSGITGTYNIYNGGVVNVSGMLGLDWQNNGGIGDINIYSGGTLNLAQIHSAGNSIQGSSLLTIANGGLLTKTGDFTSVIQTQYIDTGKIVGAGGAPLSVTYDSGANLTSVMVAAVPEPSTFALMALAGLGGLVFRRQTRK